MKTITKVLAALLLSGNTLNALAQGTTPTDITTLDNAIYMASSTEVEIGSDGSATVSICMKNSVRSTGYQFNLYLPEEIASSDVTITKSNVRKEDNYSLSHAVQTDGSIRFIGYATDGVFFEGNDGEIATIKFNSIQEGAYSFKFTQMEITSNGTRYSISEEVVSTVTFKTKEEQSIYANGYTLDITPFKAAANTAYELVLNMSCATEDITDIEFDLVVPNVLERTKQSNGRNKAPTLATDERCTTDDHSVKIDNNGHVIIESTDEEYCRIFGTSGPLIKFYYTTVTAPEEGVYQLELKNIKMTQDGGTILSVTPYSADIYVGTPKATVTDGEVVYSGDYSSEESLSLLTASLPDDFTALNLTGVTAIPEGTLFDLNNKNALIKTSTDLKLANKDNVVIGKECNSLVITDGHSFGTPWAFTADKATYYRSLGETNWGTLYLPFAVESSANVKYYALESATTATDGVMHFTELSNVEPVTPCVFYVGDGDFALNDSKVKVPKSIGSNTIDTGEEEWTISGTLTPVVKDLKVGGSDYGQNIYYIRDNKFWRATGKLTINPFRAFFQSTGAAGASYRIVIDEEGIESIEADMNLEPGHLYDLNGREVKNMQKGEIYLLNGMKVMFQ